MSNKNYLLICVMLLTSVCVNAQTETEQSDSTEIEKQSSVHIYQDERLLAMENRPAAVAAYIETMKKGAKDKATSIKSTGMDLPAANRNALTNGTKKVIATVNNVQGFRVLIYNGTNKTAAMTAKTAFNKAYPNVRSYLSYTSPRYRIKVGDFANKKDAEKFLKGILKNNPSASLVPDLVTIKDVQIQN